MYQKMITEREAGVRFDKYLHKLLPEAGSGFLYKMLRKKNILLNDKKADGNEKIACGDVVSIYFKEETLLKFMGKQPTKETPKETSDEPSYANTAAAFSQNSIGILYENEHILIADKPADILTQKAEPDDISLNEWLVSYLLADKQITPDELTTFRPSACNRLDRNTSGIVLCAKSIRGAQMLSQVLKDRSLHKFYRLYAKGAVAEEKLIDGYLHKDEKNNKVQIYSVSEAEKNRTAKNYSTAGDYIQTRYIPIRIEKDKTLLEVELITGKSHQIRAHLADDGHPLLGDYKYGDRTWNEKYRKAYGVTHQLLHAYRIVFPKLPEIFADISEKAFYSPLPEIFDTVADK